MDADRDLVGADSVPRNGVVQTIQIIQEMALWLKASGVVEQEHFYEAGLRRGLALSVWS